MTHIRDQPIPSVGARVTLTTQTDRVTSYSTGVYSGRGKYMVGARVGGYSRGRIYVACYINMQSMSCFKIIMTLLIT